MRWRCKSTVSGQMLTVFFVRSLPSRYFDDVQVCNLSADNLEDDADDDIGWKLQQFHGKWVKDVNAGGCINFQGTAAATVALWARSKKNPDKIAIQSFTVPRVRE